VPPLVENATMGANYFILWYIYICSIAKESFTYRNVPIGKTSNQVNGTLP
jgi:hypothetical protein